MVSPTMSRRLPKRRALRKNHITRICELIWINGIAEKKITAPAVRREAVVHLCSVHGMSRYRAIGVERTLVR